MAATVLVHAYAVGDGALRAQEHDVACIVRDAEHEDFAFESGDALFREVYHRQHLRTDQLAGGVERGDLCIERRSPSSAPKSTVNL